VADDGYTVGGAADVELEAIAAVGEAELERCERVLRYLLKGAGAAVAEQKRARHAASGWIRNAKV
jgi:hypothetical protein